MKQFHLLIFIFMLIFAALQYNDIDAAIWFSVYSTAAILAGITYAEVCRICGIAWACLLIIFTSYLLIALAPGISDYFEANAYTEIFFTMRDDKPYIEQTREAMGLIIVLIYCIFILIHSLFTRNKFSS